jgi:hypothetical protein
VRAPEIGFSDVILPEETLAEIRTALVQIRKHPLLVERWGVGGDGTVDPRRQRRA